MQKINSIITFLFLYFNYISNNMERQVVSPVMSLTTAGKLIYMPVIYFNHIPAVITVISSFGT